MEPPPLLGATQTVGLVVREGSLEELPDDDGDAPPASGAPDKFGGMAQPSPLEQVSGDEGAPSPQRQSGDPFLGRARGATPRQSGGRWRGALPRLSGGETSLLGRWSRSARQKPWPGWQQLQIAALTRTRD